MVTIKLKHPKCPVCGKAMHPTEYDSTFVCNPDDILVYIKIVGVPNRNNEVNRIGG